MLTSRSGHSLRSTYSAPLRFLNKVAIAIICLESNGISDSYKQTKNGLRELSLSIYCTFYRKSITGQSLIL